MKKFLPLFLALGMTGCMDYGVHGRDDGPGKPYPDSGCWDTGCEGWHHLEDSGDTASVDTAPPIDTSDTGIEEPPCEGTSWWWTGTWTDPTTSTSYDVSVFFCETCDDLEVFISDQFTGDLCEYVNLSLDSCEADHDYAAGSDRESTLEDNDCSGAKGPPAPPPAEESAWTKVIKVFVNTWPW